MLGNLNDKAVSFDREQLVSFTFGARLARRILGDTAFFQKLIQTFSLSLNFSDGHRAAIVLQFPTHRLEWTMQLVIFYPLLVIIPRIARLDLVQHQPVPRFAFRGLNLKKKEKISGKEDLSRRGEKNLIKKYSPNCLSEEISRRDF